MRLQHNTNVQAGYKRQIVSVTAHHLLPNDGAGLKLGPGDWLAANSLLENSELVKMLSNLVEPDTPIIAVL